MTYGLFQFLKRYCLDEEGATAIEYGLTAGMIGLALVTTLSLVSGNHKDVFGKIADGLLAKAPPKADGK